MPGALPRTPVIGSRSLARHILGAQPTLVLFSGATTVVIGVQSAKFEMRDEVTKKASMVQTYRGRKTFGRAPERNTAETVADPGNAKMGPWRARGVRA